MTQDERREWLINYLMKEQKRILLPRIPSDLQGQRDLLRSLFNIRMPEPVTDEFLGIQDAYLKERNRERGITDIADLKPVSSDGRLYIRQGDITTLKCGAVVNACNSQMLGCFAPLHACIDNSIHTFAGVELRLKMNEIMEAQGHEEPTGQAKITPAYNLPCDYVIHTVGPIVQERLTERHEKLLTSCYRSCLKLAEKTQVESIAFCCISTGVFGFPQQRAAEIAVETVKEYYKETGSQMKVVFNVFKDKDYAIYRRIADRWI